MRECNYKTAKELVMGRSVLYIDPWSGISGDMLLSALLDTERESGRLEEVLRRAVDTLHLGNVAVTVKRDTEWGLACTRVEVREDRVAPLRRLADMEGILAGASLSEAVRSRSIKAVRRLAEVEGAVHGRLPEDIHFHEIGAVDTIVDIVGAFALIEALDVDEVSVGAIPVGGGTVEIDHGVMGVPAPATTLLLKGYPIKGGPEPRELTTPTGALLISQLAAPQEAMPPMLTDRVGYGAGSMTLEHGPNLLRVFLGHRVDVPDGSDLAGYAPPGSGGASSAGGVVELQTNLDDVSAEVIAHTARLLRNAGALDVWTVPIQMKKERPGVVLHALVELPAESRVADIIFEQTGTLGLRRQTLSRLRAARGTVEVRVAGLPISVKWGRWRGRVVSLAPEYEDCAAAADASGLPLKDIMHVARESARTSLSPADPTR